MTVRVQGQNEALAFAMCGDSWDRCDVETGDQGMKGKPSRGGPEAVALPLAPPGAGAKELVERDEAVACDISDHWMLLFVSVVSLGESFACVFSGPGSSTYRARW